jgi:hypothetical protein
MKRLALVVLLLTAIAVGAFLASHRPGVQASPDVTISVNSTADTNVRDSVMTLREAMLLATGGLSIGALTQEECYQVSGAIYLKAGCLRTPPPGAASADTIVFDASVFPPGSPATIAINDDLPILSTGNDTIDGTSAGVIVDGTDATLSDCFNITSNNNTIKGLQISNCYITSVEIGGGAQNNTIGGSNPGEGNVISDCGMGSHVFIGGSGTSGNVVKGNRIQGCTQPGVVIRNGAQNNTIGGSSPGDRNIISSTLGGVGIGGSGTDGNAVIGNYIGTDAAGNAATPNSTGVIIHAGASNNTIGGSSAGDRNVISGNLQEGVFISGSGTSGNVVKGNYIGTNASGTAGLPNGAQGVAIGVGAQDNTIGGTAAGEGNLIAYNEDDGVWVYGTDATGNTIRGNSIHSNGDMGIVNSNGGNTELAPPVITGFGSVIGTACAGCTVDIYSDDEDEGRVYEGSTTANAAGNWSFSGSLERPNVTATATDAAGNTSEFSPPVAVPEPTPTPSPTPTPTPSPTPSPTPTATPTGTPTPGTTRTLVLGPGWHNETWSGASTPAEAFACAAGKYAAAYRFTDVGLERYFPDRPDISNMGPLAQYDAFLILVTQPVTCAMPVAAASGSSRTLQWGVGWHNEGWSGADGTAPEEAFSCAAGSYAAAYRFTETGLERYFPNRPDISNMGPLNKYDAFLILVTAPVSCTMAIAP